MVQDADAIYREEIEKAAENWTKENGISASISAKATPDERFNT